MSHAGREPISLAPLTAHHDGSALYVSNPYPEAGEVLRFRIRVGTELSVTEVHLRSTVDGDQRFTPCVPTGATFTAAGGKRSCPWRTPGCGTASCSRPAGARTLNSTGLHAREVPDTHDFRVTTDPEPPSWVQGAVFYEIFLDRFARGRERDPGSHTTPAWAVPADWDDPVAHSGPDGVRQLYGGDLGGILEHLDHLSDLGVSALYLTPFFPAGSNHRYDASTFAHVDPMLGGDGALRALVAAAHERDIRVVGDLTLNHTGDTHEWFSAAVVDDGSSEAGFYLFTEHPVGYEAFSDVPTLPRLDHRSPELRRRLFEGDRSVVHRYLTEFDLDGWRIDVAQSAGHSGTSDRTRQSARATVGTARAARSDAYVVAEHPFDAGEALAGDGWHGAMAYAAFTRPVWSWLAETDIDTYWGAPGAHPPYTGRTMAEVIDEFNGTIPWRSRIHSLTLLDSHDTPRLLSVIGSQRFRVALGLLMTMPGVPMVFAGDEIGTHGINLEDGRQPFRWDRRSWDHDTYELHRRLIRLRRAQPALVQGGFRWLHTDDDVVLFERATAQGAVIVQASRRAHDPILCPFDATDLLGEADLTSGCPFPSEGPAVGLWRVSHPAEQG